ncbi:MAG: hypothetical protein QM572_15375 [Nocardioides sp.]|uniref:hypothetical protein n=1 Tax=Nocardioides sp. TaxID=35761 RepID=UPI0039E42F52
MATFENWGDYFWPGQIDECLRNKLDLRDPIALADAERRRTYLRSLELVDGKISVPQTFDLEHLQAIHAHVFGDVYEWAGQLRVTELVRPGSDPNEPGHEFMKPELIETMAPHVFAQAGPKPSRSAPGRCARR